jgi:hypothetical protein
MHTPRAQSSGVSQSPGQGTRNTAGKSNHIQSCYGGIEGTARRSRHAAQECAPLILYCTTIACTIVSYSTNSVGAPAQVLNSAISTRAALLGGKYLRNRNRAVANNSFTSFQESKRQGHHLIYSTVLYYSSR